MIKFKYKGEIEIELKFPDNAPNLVPFEQMEELSKEVPGDIEKCVVDGMIDTDYYHKVSVKTIQSEVTKEDE